MSMKIASVAAVIINYKVDPWLIEQSINSIVIAEKHGFMIDIYMHDNNKKSTLNFSSNPRIRISNGTGNIGYSRAMNFTLIKNKILDHYSHVLVINPDVVLDSNFWKNLKIICDESNEELPVLIPITFLKFTKMIYKMDNKVNLLFNKKLEASLVDTKTRRSFVVTPYNSMGLPCEGERDEIKYLALDSDKFNKLESRNLQIRANDSQLLSCVREDWIEKCIVSNNGSFIGNLWVAGDKDNGKLAVNCEEIENKQEPYWSCACAIVSVDFFRKVGFFDERFFLYYEDSDLSLRGMQAGMPATLRRELIAYHDQSHSSLKNPLRRRFQLVKSGTLFSLKYYGASKTLLGIKKELTEELGKGNLLGIFRALFRIWFFLDSKRTSNSIISLEVKQDIQ